MIVKQPVTNRLVIGQNAPQRRFTANQTCAAWVDIKCAFRVQAAYAVNGVKRSYNDVSARRKACGAVSYKVDGPV